MEYLPSEADDPPPLLAVRVEHVRVVLRRVGVSRVVVVVAVVVIAVAAEEICDLGGRREQKKTSRSGRR